MSEGFSEGLPIRSYPLPEQAAERIMQSGYRNLSLLLAHFSTTPHINLTNRSILNSFLNNTLRNNAEDLMCQQ